MIDTIQFSVLETHLYPNMISYLEVVSEQKKAVIHHKPELLHTQLYYYNDSDNQILSRSGKFRVPSSDYRVAFQIDYRNRSVKFNVSVPKFLYGHNIKMLVPHKLDREFDYINGCNIESNLRQAYELLHRFINHFNDTYLQVNLRHIVLNRIDLCFNQFFSSVNEKNLYLSCCKRKAPKYARNISNNPVYKTGIYLSSRYCTYKIYDKGVEFRKNDSKELAKSGVDPVRIKELQSISDKVLRYEVEFKASFFKNFLSRQRENMVGSYMDYMCKKWKVSHVSELYTRSYMHELNFDPESIEFFNKKLYYVACKRFWCFLKQYRITTLDLSELDIKVQRFNAFGKNTRHKNYRTVQVNSLKRFCEDLMKYGKDEIRRLGLYSDRTYYRNLVRMKKVGIGSPEIIAPFSFMDNWNLNIYHTKF